MISSVNYQQMQGRIQQIVQGGSGAPVDTTPPPPPPKSAPGMYCHLFSTKTN